MSQLGSDQKRTCFPCVFLENVEDTLIGKEGNSYHPGRARQRLPKQEDLGINLHCLRCAGVHRCVDYSCAWQLHRSRLIYRQSRAFPQRWSS